MIPYHHLSTSKNILKKVCGMFLIRKKINRRNLQVLFILAIEAIILYCGVTVPLVDVRHFWIFEEQQSVIQILITFYQHDEFFLLIVVSVMGVILPFLKLIFRGIELEGNIINFISRFSSLDIFLIAILVFVGKTISVVDVSLSSGFYFLCTGIIMGLVKVENFLKPCFQDPDTKIKLVEEEK
jgi:uncharacterized paraquat-inducible protein A